MDKGATGFRRVLWGGTGSLDGRRDLEEEDDEEGALLFRRRFLSPLFAGVEDEILVVKLEKS